jgi:hypothetical protein
MCQKAKVWFLQRGGGLKGRLQARGWGRPGGAPPTEITEGKPEGRALAYLAESSQ